MNIDETARLVAFIAAGDNRTIDKTVIRYWEDVLPEWITLDDARNAVREHRRTTTEYLQAAHIIATCERQRETRYENERRNDEYQRALDPTPVPAAFSPSGYFATYPEEWDNLDAAGKRIFRNMYPGDLGDKA
jgi:hypothetical protein